LVKKARESIQHDKSINWLKPFTTQRKYRAGDVLFYKGDPANEMFFTVTGKFLVSEIGVELPPGRLVGELGFLSPNNRRTMTVECLEDGDVLTITYDKLLEICFENPEFGYYFLRVSSERLLERIARLEALVNQGKDPEVRDAAMPKPGPRPSVDRGQSAEHVVIPGLSTWA
jgi:CRP-like cAMP-binding protein